MTHPWKGAWLIINTYQANREPGEAPSPAVGILGNKPWRAKQKVGAHRTIKRLEVKRVGEKGVPVNAGRVS